MLRILPIFIIASLSFVSRADAVYELIAGDHSLAPNTSTQTIAIMLTSDAGDQPIAGGNLNVLIDGSNPKPVFTGTPGSRDAVDYAGSGPTTTIWNVGINVSGEGPETNFPNLVATSVTVQDTNMSLSNPSGRFVNLSVDTSGLSSGVYPLLLSGTLSGSAFTSDLILSNGSTLAPALTDGTITIVPEPSAFLLLGLVFATGTGCRILWRRFARWMG